MNRIAKALAGAALVVTTGIGAAEAQTVLKASHQFPGGKGDPRDEMVQMIARDVAAAERAWAKAEDLMADASLDLVVLDELNIALRYDYLPVDAVVAALKARREGLHVVVTGRNAKPALIEAADLVTEMTLVKHHFAAGVKAQEGVEF